MACVKFGMLADEADLVDLVKLVAQRGKELEESSKVSQDCLLYLNIY